MRVELKSTKPSETERDDISDLREREYVDVVVLLRTSWIKDR